MERKLIKSFFNEKILSEIGNEVEVKGWVRTRRDSKHVSFLSLNDGTIIHSVQVVCDRDKIDENNLKQATTGSSVQVKGSIVRSPSPAQLVEIQAHDIQIIGSCPADIYPLQKKGHSLEFLREIAHLRPRTNTFGSIFRIRHHAAFAIHKFYHDRGFYYIHTPIITASDCEGAGAMFRVTTLDLKNPPLTPDGDINWTEDFFGKEAKLTVSGQLEAELGALALSHVYTFGPTFRAENSNTPRHLAEFWMIEPEMAFYDINDNMNLAEEFLKFIITFILDNSKDDLLFLQNMYQKNLIKQLEATKDCSFERIKYSESIEILQKSNKQFEYTPTYGKDLQTEHERFLVEEYFQKPVIITDYPKDIKAFYMKMNDDNQTVRAMDVLFPRIGEIIGGSQREENYEKLLKRIRELDIPEKDVWWYLETRIFGTVPHSGFGLGFERLLLFLTGMSNIRDVIPFPRTPNNVEF